MIKNWNCPLQPLWARGIGPRFLTKGRHCLPRSIATLAVAAIVLAACAPIRAAETVARKHEKALTGEITDISKTEVTIKVKSPKDETVVVPANEVQSISWTGESPEANLARGDETGGRYQRAIDNYTKALAGSKSSNALARTELEYGIIRSGARLALTDPARMDEAIKKLDEFRSKQSGHYRYYDAVALLGQLYLAKKEFGKAQTTFDLLARAPWKDAQTAARIAIARLMQAENKLDEALAAYEAVVAQSADGGADASQRQEALLGKSRVLISQKKFDEAQKLLQDVIKEADAEDAKVQAEASVRLGDCYRELGQDKDALLAYLRVEVLFSSEKALEAEALFHLTRLFEKVGQKGRAAEVRDKLEGDEFKNSEWARQLKAPAAS